MGEIDPVTREIIASGLIYTTVKMKEAMMRTAYSPIIYAQSDYSVALLDANADLIAQKEGCPIHLASIHYCVKEPVKKYFPWSKLAEHDVIIHNDPYTGGSHLADVNIFMPIFSPRTGEPLAFAAVRAHWPDIGGNAPGSYGCQSTDIYMEGLRLKPCKLLEKGIENELIFDIIRQNTRISYERIGDLRAAVAALFTAEKAVHEYVKKYGEEVVGETIKYMLDDSEARVKRDIMNIPDGEYESWTFIDDDGIGKNPIEIRCKLTIRGDSIDVDLTDCPPCTLGPINSTYANTCSSVFIAIKMVTDPKTMNNAGFFRPIYVKTKPGTVLHAIEPYPVVLSTTVPSTRVVETVIRCLAQAIPDRVRAEDYGSSLVTIIGGKHPHINENYVWFDIGSGGWGAFSTGDGTSTYLVIGNEKDQPAELMESKYPIIMMAYEFRTDSGGPGKFRGGLGQHKDFIFYGDMGIYSVASDRHRFPPAGFFGGRPGALNEVVLNPDTPNERVFGYEYYNTGKFENAKVSNIIIKKGTYLSHRTGGGGGYGDPLERDPVAVREDVIDEYVSIEGARRDYGVVIDPETFEIDWEATEKLRQEMKARKRWPDSKPPTFNENIEDAAIPVDVLNRIKRKKNES